MKAKPFFFLESVHKTIIYTKDAQLVARGPDPGPRTCFFRPSHQVKQ